MLFSRCLSTLVHPVIIETSTTVRYVGKTRFEWALLALIAAVCAILSFLQYSWTGELSKAEPALLRAGLNQQLRLLSQRLNNDIREDCTSLMPDAPEIRGRDRTAVVRSRYGQWRSSHDRDLFKRIALAVPENGEVLLYTIDSTGTIEPVSWPTDWENLRRAMVSHLEGVGRPPNVAQQTDLIQMPIFAEAGAEAGWMVFEMSESYIRNKVLPRLVSEYLNPLEQDYDVSVSPANAEGDVIFSTRKDGKGVAAHADATAGLLSVEIGGARGRGRGRGRDQGRGTRWVIAVRHRAGSLEAAVTAARGKNLIASLMLVGLLGSAAWALVQYTARSRRLAEMQFQFAAGISHDLRTPLTAIRGAAFNLVEGVVKEPAAVSRYLRLILRNSEELTAMIENVLAFSASLQSGTHAPSESLALGEVLRRAVETMTPEVEQAGCRMEVNIAGDLPAVAGDGVAVELVFRNLIGNAVRHGVGGKWIGVSASVHGQEVQVRVSDHGPGVAEEERERIFEPFYRGEQTRTSQVPGTGLGLSLVRNTIERYQGKVEVNNSPGGGAQFTVRLPALHQTT